VAAPAASTTAGRPPGQRRPQSRHFDTDRGDALGDPATGHEVNAPPGSLVEERGGPVRDPLPVGFHRAGAQANGLLAFVVNL